MGRLLITLYLVNAKILNRPVLYFSDFFEGNRSHYYDNLTIVRTKNDLLQWLTFFLVGVLETANNAIDTFNSIISLRNQIEESKISKLGKRIPKAKLLFKYLYSKPILPMSEIASALEVDISTAHRLIKDFENLGLLKEKTGFKRNRVFIFEAYLKIFEK